MNNNDLISHYEQVAKITGHMLDAAKASDWDRLSELEVTCSHRVQVIREQASTPEISDENRQRKIDLIKKILADDKAIRDLTEPWMHHLSNLMKNSNTSRKLSEAYGSNQMR